MRADEKSLKRLSFMGFVIFPHTELNKIFYDIERNFTEKSTAKKFLRSVFNFFGYFLTTERGIKALPKYQKYLADLILQSKDTSPQETKKIMHIEYNNCQELRQHMRALRQVCKIRIPDNAELIRVGKENDGGYAMVDNFSSISEPKIAYGYGIDQDVSWDVYMANKGYDIFMYDHTIEKLPQENEHFHFTKKGLGYAGNDIQLETLETHIKNNQHQDYNNFILKMDIEGAEWDFLLQAEDSTLEKFSQIVFELHDLLDFSQSSKMIEALRRLNKTHQLVHVHANNNSQAITVDGFTVSNLLEATYLKKTSQTTFSSATGVTYPTKIDQPCVPHIPEIQLGDWS